MAFNYLEICNELQLITITHYHYPISAIDGCQEQVAETRS